MVNKRSALTELHAALGYKRLNRTWSKLEILIGLAVAGSGLLFGSWTLTRPNADIEWGLTTAGLALFVLGGYLALAGHRSHLYQSGNERTAYLAELIHRLNDKG